MSNSNLKVFGSYNRLILNLKKVVFTSEYDNSVKMFYTIEDLFRHGLIILCSYKENV